MSTSTNSHEVRFAVVLEGTPYYERYLDVPDAPMFQELQAPGPNSRIGGAAKERVTYIIDHQLR